MIKKIYRFLHPRFQTVFLDYRVSFKPRYGHGHPPHQVLYDIINSNRSVYEENLKLILNNTEVFHNIKELTDETDPGKPGWNNGFLPGLDIMALYTLIDKYRPSVYVEIGSGNSTKVAHKARQEKSPETKIVSIDPYPRAEIDDLADSIVRIPFEQLNLSDFPAMKAGDILFVDNSHRILPNSDAMVFFLEILPSLPPGVIVQIHDVYLPYDYPQFMCDRAYSEQYGLAMYLLSNPEKYKPILPNYFVYEDKELSGILSSVWDHPTMQNVERHGGSFWLQITG